MRPQIGDTVLITLKSAGDRVVPGSKVVDRIEAVYIEGGVRVTSGDVWKVIPCKSNEAKYMTAA